MNTKDVKGIKIVGADTRRVMSNNEVWWEKNSLLKPDYEFYDSEIGKNSNWSRRSDGYYYLNKFKGEKVVFVRYKIVNQTNTFALNVGGTVLNNPWVFMDEVNDYIIFMFADGYENHNCEDYLLKENNDNTYKSYVLKCPEKYDEEFAQKLKDFANSL